MKESRFVAEESGNHFLVKSIAYTFLGTFIVAFMNWFNIFGTNFVVTQSCFIIVTVLGLIGCAITLLFKFKSNWMKYVLMTILELQTLTLSSCLTFHATIIIIFPIVYCTVFRNKRFVLFTYVLSAVFMIAAVYLGYFYGVCDLNTVFLPVNNIKDTVDLNGTVHGTDFILDGTWWKLLLYFGAPRVLILTVFTPVCVSIMNRIAKLSDTAVRYEFLAIHDGMTGLYNKRHFSQKEDTEFCNLRDVGVIFIDANNLKFVNDTFGHECGDDFILTIAKSIQAVSSDSVQGFRVGGDEFVIVVSNPTLENVRKLEEQITDGILMIHKDTSIPYAIAVGHSIGTGSTFAEVYKEAERRMYQNKAMYKKEHRR